MRELWAHAPALVSAVEDAASIGAGRHVSLPRVPAPASDSGGRAGKGAAVAGPELQVRLARCLSCAHAAESRGSASRGSAIGCIALPVTCMTVMQVMHAAQC